MDWTSTLDEAVEEVPSEDEALAVEACESRRASADQGQEAREVEEDEELLAHGEDARPNEGRGGDSAAREVVERLSPVSAAPQRPEAGAKRAATEVQESQVDNSATAERGRERSAEAAPTGGASVKQERPQGSSRVDKLHGDREEVCRAVDRVREAERNKRGLKDALVRVRREKAGSGRGGRRPGRATLAKDSARQGSAAAATVSLRGAAPQQRRQCHRADARQAHSTPTTKSPAAVPSLAAEAQSAPPGSAPAPDADQAGGSAGVDSRVHFLRELIRERSARMQRAENEAESARHAHMQRMLQETEKRLSLFAQLDSAVAEAASASGCDPDAGR